MERIIPMLNKQLKGGITPILGGNVKTEEIELIHEPHIIEGARLLRGFSYRELNKFKDSLKKELICSNCSTSLLKVAAYFKMHICEHPHTYKFCMYVFKNMLSLEGQELYDYYPEYRAEIFNNLNSEREEYLSHPLYELYEIEKLCETKEAHSRKMYTREMPHSSCFPSYKLNKKSKMFLTQLEPPTQDIVQEFKELVRKLVRQYGPRSIDIPAPEAVTSLGPSLYSDGHVPRPDYEKPVNTWKYSWTLQRFKTSPLTEREVWLPPKSYKICSSWWHFLAEPINSRIPYVVCNDTMTDLRKKLHSRFKPCIKIDLKGFGLQYPHEYIIATMEVLEEIYPSQDVSEYKQLCEKLFSIMSIKGEDDKFIKPKRGVGLGYFANLMTLGVAAILQDMNVISMFSDDILIDAERYNEALHNLRYFKFILNEAKTGKYWHKAPFFAGVCMTPKGSIRYGEAQAEKAAIHNKRYHYERKNCFLSCNWDKPWLMAYHMERLYGYEIQRGEAFLHPNVLGLNPQASKPVGWVKGGILKEYKTPKPQGDETLRRFWSIKFPWKNPHEKKEFHRIRKDAKKYKNVIHYTEYDEYLNPDIEPISRVAIEKPDFFLGKYQLPRWADLQLMLGRNETTGRTTMGRYPKLAARGLLDNLLSRDPIGSWVAGGYNIISPFAREPGLNPDNQLLYEMLRTVKRTGTNSVNKREGLDSISSVNTGEGIKFLTQIKEEKDLPIEIHEEEEEETSDYEGPLDFLEEEDVDIAYVDEDEADLGVILNDEE